MKTVRRVLARGLIGISGVVCMVTMILWARCSGTRSDELEVVWERGYGIHSLGGRIYLSVFWDSHWKALSYPRVDWRSDYRWSAGLWSAMVMHEHGRVVGRFGIAKVDLPSGEAVRPSVREVMVPHWFVIALTGVWPVARIGRRLRRRRWRRSGRCVECGYDLRGSMGRCSECGAVFERGVGTGSS